MNSSSHSFNDIGGKSRGFQSVIANPDFVRRVIPPTDTIKEMKLPVKSSHLPTGALAFNELDWIKGRENGCNLRSDVVVDGG